MINIKSIQLKNFIVKGDLFIDFEKYKGLTLVEGSTDNTSCISNGSGKSAIAEAIVFPTSGKTIRGIKGDDVVNIHTNNGSFVELTFDKGGSEYVVTHTRKPYNVSVTVNGVSPFDDDIKKNDEVLKYCTEALGYPFEAFSSMLILGGNQGFADMKPTERCQLMIKATGLDKWESRKNYTKKFLKSVMSELNELREEIDKTTMLVEGSQSRLDDYRRKSKVFEDKKKLAIMTVKKELLDAKAVLREAKKIKPEVDYSNEVKKLKVQNAKIEEQYGNFVDIIKKHEETIHDLQSKANSFKVKVSERIHSIKRLNVDIREIKELIKEAGSLDVRCEHCGSAVTEDGKEKHIEHLKDDITKKNAKISLKDDEIGLLEEELDDVNDCIDALEAEIRVIKDAEAKRLSNTSKLMTLDNKTKQAFMERESLITAAKNEIRLMEKRLADKESECNPYADLTDKEKKELSGYDAELLEEYEEEKESLEHVEYITACLDIFSKIRVQIFDNILKSLEDKTNEYMKDIDPSIFIEYASSRELKTSKRMKDEISIFVLDNGIRRPYEGYSKGEKQKIRVAIAAAFAEVIGKGYSNDIPNIQFFDEPSDGVDEAGRKNIFNLLHRMSKTYKVFVMDHDAQFKEMFDNVMVVRREGNKVKII